uniref:Uncharacterized protein n=1 Tax=Arundo donax TaxID=35708 RepID=A0A0A9ANU3_ARUDO
MNLRFLAAIKSFCKRKMVSSAYCSTDTPPSTK